MPNHTKNLAAKELGLKTAKYFYAKSYEELKEAAEKIGYPCVIKPLMSSSGKGQSVAKGPEDLQYSWDYGCSGSRGDIKELIVEEFIKFDSEITLLTVTQKNGPVHKVRQRDYTSYSYPEERSYIVLPSNRTCTEGRRLS